MVYEPVEMFIHLGRDLSLSVLRVDDLEIKKLQQ